MELAREIDGTEVVYVAAKDLILVGHAEIAKFFGEVEKRERQRWYPSYYEYGAQKLGAKDAATCG